MTELELPRRFVDGEKVKKTQVVHIHLGDNSEIDRVVASTDELKESLMASLAALATEVATIHSVSDSVQALITKLVADIEAAGTDQVALDALVADLTTQSDALSAAVAANTPAEEPPA